MTSNDLIREYAWAIAAAVGILFLLSRYIMRRLRERREERERVLAEQTGETPMVTPDEFSRARKLFLLTLVLVIVVVILSILTHFQ
jgi:cell division protein FtsL